jgi:transglutaminase-like putative cysteine protease
MNLRLTVTAAVAVILSSVSLFAVVEGAGWLYAGIGAVAAVALAGTLTRLPPVQASSAAIVLALVAAFPLIESGSWDGVVGGGIIIAGTVASLSRRRVYQAFAALVTYLALLLIYLNLVFAGPQSLGWIVPTTRSLRHLWLLAGQGMAERSFAPPVPGFHGIELAIAGGIGLVAVVTDLIAVRLRSPAVAGLPLLVLFSVPVTTAAKEAGVGEVVAFCLGMTGFLAMLAADGRERLRIWGRLVTVWHGADDEPERGPDTRALAASGRRVGLAAVCLAVVAPLLLPGLRAHSLFHKGPPSGVLVSLPKPLVQMQGQLLRTATLPVLTYRAGKGDAGQYLQVYVLNYDSFSRNWTLVAPGSRSELVSGQRSLPAAPGLTSGTPAQKIMIRVTLGQISGYGSKTFSALPLPYAPSRLQVPGAWRADDATLMVYSTGADLSGLTYSVTSRAADPAPVVLDGEAAAVPPGNQNYLSFASPERAALRKIALRITRKATTPYQQALALQNYFLKPGRFDYSLQTNIKNSPAGLLDFLTTDRRGYCQQFAFAMAALARLLGIPSRIAVGYTAGTRQSNGTWQVTTADAHAWPELYFAGAGWLRFEPTPGGSTGQGTATVPPYAAQAPPGTPGSSDQIPLPTTPAPAGGPGGTSGIQSKLNHDITNGGGGAGSVSAAHRGSAPVLPLGLAAAVIVALAAVAPRLVRSVTRRRRWRTAHDDAALAHAAWQELRDDLVDLGLDVRASESPRAVASRIGPAQELPEAARAALRRVARAEERARYAAAPLPSETLRGDVTAVRKALSAQTTRTNRWRARLMPASTLGLLRAGLRHWLEVFDWLDATRLRMRRSPGSELADRPG